MGYRLREYAAESKFINELTLEAIGQAVPLAEVKAALQEEQVQEGRERKLNMVSTLFLVIAMSIYTRLSIGDVMRKLAQGLRFVWRDPSHRLAKDSALTYRRYQLGARPVVRLFHRVCRPMTTQDTRGAFLFGLRLMAIDGTIEDVPDTPGNDAAFGRQHGSRGDSAFPQVQGVYLAECGSHAIVDAGFWPYHVSERVGGFRMLRSIEPGMLVMWDRGFHAYEMIARAQQRGAQVLSRLPAHVRPKRIRTLADGSYLAYLSDGAPTKIGSYLCTDP